MFRDYITVIISRHWLYIHSEGWKWIYVHSIAGHLQYSVAQMGNEVSVVGMANNTNNIPKRIDEEKQAVASSTPSIDDILEPSPY